MDLLTGGSEDRRGRKGVNSEGDVNRVIDATLMDALPVTGWTRWVDEDQLARLTTLLLLFK